jgi:hypothetical protein
MTAVRVAPPRADGDDAAAVDARPVELGEVAARAIWVLLDAR